MKKKIAVIGLGYVGLPLTIAFSKYFKVIGFDIDIERIRSLNNSVDSNGDIQFKKNDNLSFTHKEKEIADANIFIITVPTPVNSKQIPDLSFLKSATNMVASYLNKGDIVIYESTVYPGLTEEICVPILERVSTMKYNTDFYCGYSPERISPGAQKYTLQNIVKITSGSNDEVANEIDELYKKIIIAGTYKAKSIKVAEAAKVVENTQRDVNIALINELAMMFDTMNIDTSEVLEAANTKWNFMNFKPGLVGGHCIGVDPYYLLYKSERIGYKPDLLHSSREINNSVANFIAQKTIQLMIQEDKTVKNSSVLVLGYTFKENCADTRNTKVKDIVEGLNSFSCNVSIYDPYISSKSNNRFISNPLDIDKKYDSIIVAVSHTEFVNYTTIDFNQLSKGKPLVLDIKGIYKESSWRL